MYSGHIVYELIYSYLVGGLVLIFVQQEALTLQAQLSLIKKVVKQ